MRNLSRNSKDRVCVATHVKSSVSLTLQVFTFLEIVEFACNAEGGGAGNDIRHRVSGTSYRRLSPQEFPLLLRDSALHSEGARKPHELDVNACQFTLSPNTESTVFAAILNTNKLPGNQSDLKAVK